MTWPSSGARDGAARLAGRGAPGFTLIEVIVVLVVLALVATIFVGRGPMRSRGVEAAGAARQLAETMRLARSQAIATDRPVSVSVDPVRHLYASGADIHVLPGDIGVAVQGPDGAAARALAILFRPDGSSSGGSVALAEGARTLHVSVDWITGRVVLVD